MQDMIIRRKIACAAAGAPPARDTADRILATCTDYFGGEATMAGFAASAAPQTEIMALAGDRTAYVFQAHLAQRLVCLDDAAIIAASDRALGRLPADANVAATHVDRVLASGLAQRLAAAPRATQNAQSPALRLAAIGSVVDGAGAMPLACHAYRADIAFADRDGRLTAWIFASAPAEDAADFARARDSVVKSVATRIAAGAGVDARVEIGVASAPLSAIMRLAAGDVLPVSRFGAAQLISGDGARAFAHGMVGDSGGNRAFRINAA